MGKKSVEGLNQGGAWMEQNAITMEPGMIRLPQRDAYSHKGDYGRLFILAGSRGYTGAAALCARAAVRGGAGLVTAAVPEDIYPIVAVKCDEAMVWPWEADDQALLDQGERAERLVTALLRELECPVILDADGLNIVSRHINVLDERVGEAILTPHDGEFARLSGCSLPIRDRRESARRFAQAHRCTLVLKGRRTISARPDGTCVVNSTGNPGMAKGGSGDALAGLMAALVVQGIPNAVPAAVWLHGRAGDLAAADKGEYGMTPSDLIEQIPYAIKEVM